MAPHAQALPVQAVGRSLDIIEAVAQAEPHGLPLSRIAESVRLRPSTTHNLVKSLRIRGWLRQSASGRYALGWKIFSLGRAGGLDIRPGGPVASILEQAAQTVREALVLATLVNGRRRVLARVNVRRTVLVDLEAIGNDQKPFWEMVTSRVLAAYCDADELQHVLDTEGLPGEAWPGVADHSGIQARLRDIRRRGVAEDRGEDIASVAVPVLDGRDRLLAALGSFLPAYRYENTRETLVCELRNTARRLARVLETEVADAFGTARNASPSQESQQ